MTAWDPYVAASMGGYEEYVKNYDQEIIDGFRAKGRGEPLLQALGNHSAVDRVKISNFLLDRGADASARAKGEKVNALHVLFGVRNHDFTLEAPLLGRILRGGADVNFYSPRFGRPLEMLWKLPADDDDMRPFYEVFFSDPNIDLDLLIREGRPYTQRDLLRGVSPRLRHMHECAQSYLEAHPEPQ